jgi:hypothetical protein
LLPVDGIATRDLRQASGDKQAGAMVEIQRQAVVSQPVFASNRAGE